jgi:hypothetical protein
MFKKARHCHTRSLETTDIQAVTKPESEHAESAGERFEDNFLRAG